MTVRHPIATYATVAHGFDNGYSTGARNHHEGGLVVPVRPRIAVTIGPEELSELEALADSLGLSVSALVRVIVTTRMPAIRVLLQAGSKLSYSELVARLGR